MTDYEQRRPRRHSWWVLAALLAALGLAVALKASRGTHPPRSAAGAGCAPGLVGDQCR